MSYYRRLKCIDSRHSSIGLLPVLDSFFSVWRLPPQEFSYGLLEMRAKIDTRPGLWPSWWAVGDFDKVAWPKNGEIEMMEAFQGGKVGEGGRVWKFFLGIYIFGGFGSFWGSFGSSSFGFIWICLGGGKFLEVFLEVLEVMLVL